MSKLRPIRPAPPNNLADRPHDRAHNLISRSSINQSYRKYLALKPSELKRIKLSDLTLAENIAYKAAIKAQSDLGYLKEVTDRVEGKPVQAIAQIGKQEFTVSFISSQ